MSRRIKEVNGIKVLRRYSAGSIFSGLICLGLAVVPILLLVLPVVSFVPKGGGDPIGMSILDIIKGIPSVKPFLGAVLDAETAPSFFPLVNIAYGWTMFGLWAIIAIFSALLVFFGLEFLFRGKVTHFKTPMVLSNFPAFSMIALLGVAISSKFVYQFFGQTYGDVRFTSCIIYSIVSVLGMILLSVIYVTAFKDRVFIGDLGDLREASGERVNKEKGQLKYETKEIVKVRYEPAIGLPSTLSSIGGHAFSQNMNLVVAMIPLGIKTLGQAAFSNCGRLKIVSIPTSVKSIGFNCFFNCANLKRINYAGTKEQWRHIKRGSNWLAKAGTYTVVCIDGAIIVNPYH